MKFKVCMVGKSKGASNEGECAHSEKPVGDVMQSTMNRMSAADGCTEKLEKAEVNMLGVTNVCTV